jgi:hypothetical protein
LRCRFLSSHKYLSLFLILSIFYPQTAKFRNKNIMSLSPSVLNFFLPSESPLPPAPPELTVQASSTPSTSTSDANLNPVSYTELATLSKVSQEWSDCVLSAFVLPTTSISQGSPTYILNPKLTKCLCWFDERGIEARSVSVRRGGKRGGKDLITLCTGWRGWEGVDEVMEIMGFEERFRNRVREKLGEGEDGMVVGSKRAHVMSKADQVRPRGGVIDLVVRTWCCDVVSK